MTDILLREQSETSGGYWHQHKLEGAVYSPNLGSAKPPHSHQFPPAPRFYE